MVVRGGGPGGGVVAGRRGSGPVSPMGMKKDRRVHVGWSSAVREGERIPGTIRYARGYAARLVPGSSRRFSVSGWVVDVNAVSSESVDGPRRRRMEREEDLCPGNQGDAGRWRR